MYAARSNLFFRSSEIFLLTLTKCVERSLPRSANPETIWGAEIATTDIAEAKDAQSFRGSREQMAGNVEFVQTPPTVVPILCVGGLKRSAQLRGAIAWRYRKVRDRPYKRVPDTIADQQVPELLPGKAFPETALLAGAVVNAGRNFGFRLDFG